MKTKRTIKKSILLIMFILNMISFQNCRAQVDLEFKSDPTKLYTLVLFDDTELIGNIIEMDSAVLVVKTLNIPRMEIPVKNVSKITEVNPNNFHKGVYWYPNPNPTRYLISTSGQSLEAGEGYYQNLMISINSFNVGITKHISLMAGFEWTSLMLGEPAVLLSPKVSYDLSKKTKAASGVLFVHVPGNTGGIIYEVLTFGNNDSNLTTGLGFGFVDNQFSGKPVINLAGMKRVGKSISLITENWIIPSDGLYSMFSYGLRFFNRKLAVDLAFINNEVISEFFPLGLPMVDFVVTFGKKKRRK